MSFQDLFKSQIASQLQKELGIKNKHQIPKVVSVKINSGIGRLSTAKRNFDHVVSNVEGITGQKAVVTKSKKSVSNFKLREGMANGVTVTLRGQKMYEFLYRLIHITLPRVRDFRGISPRSFDGSGNYNLGFKEMAVFPEVSPEDATQSHGVQITVVTSAKKDEEGLALLKAMGFPFKEI